MKQFVSIQLSMGRPTVSVITREYFAELQVSAPQFYNEFLTRSFASELSFTQLNALLPFRIVGSDTLAQLELLTVRELNDAEIQFLDAHRTILNLYWHCKLAPLPPWRIVKMDLSQIRNIGDLATHFRQALGCRQ